MYNSTSNRASIILTLCLACPTPLELAATSALQPSRNNLLTSLGNGDFIWNWDSNLIIFKKMWGKIIECEDLIYGFYFNVDRKKENVRKKFEKMFDNEMMKEFCYWK